MTLQTEGKSQENEMETLQEKINLITKYQKPYVANSLKRMVEKSTCNVKVICEYIIAEQNEINIKESTKEGKIKCLVRFSTYINHKPFHTICRQDILDYLTSLKKPESTDPQHKSVGTYNGRQMILLKFFRWLYNPNESDARKRLTPECMNGVKRLPRMEKSAYKPSDLWTEEEHEIFLKYCPSPRDKAFHSMAYDTSARPSELLAVRIGDIFFRKGADGTQYAEIVVTGKTKSRTLPLIFSLPYLKQFLLVHPQGTNPDAWLFISYSKQNNLGRITRDGLLKKYEQYYKKRFFPSLLEIDSVSERDKAYIRNMLMKPFSLYIFRHTALTHKSSFLKEHILTDHAGWSMTSKMPQVYIHYFGTESSNSILEAYGIAKNESMRTNVLKPLFRVSQLIDISIFAMIDNDKDVDKNILKMKEGAKELGYTKEIIIRKWDRDFESENFGTDNVIEKINQLLRENGYIEVNKEQVEKRMKSSGDALVKAAENEIGRLNHDKFKGSKKARDVISKPHLANLLLEQRLKEIQIIDDPAWEAKLPIEIELKKAFKLIPSYR